MKTRFYLVVAPNWWGATDITEVGFGKSPLAGKAAITRGNYHSFSTLQFTKLTGIPVPKARTVYQVTFEATEVK